jgi:hydroxymethylglutaryl-CoA synthase
MRGLLSYAAYVPRWRLPLGDVSAFLGKGGGKGTRAVASYDEDTTTLGFEAARRALANLPASLGPQEIWFATADPAYADKTNANAIHAALRLGSEVPTMDMVGAVRSGVGALRIALGADGRELVVAADIRTGPPGSHDEAAGGDGAAAVLTGTDADGPLIAELLASTSAVGEFLDRWRIPGEQASGVWEERLGESVYAPLFHDAWTRALKTAALTAADVDRLVVTGTHDRAIRQAVAASGVPADQCTRSLTGVVGNVGAADPLLLLSGALDVAEPGRVIALVCLADGVDVIVFRTTQALPAARQQHAVTEQIADALPVTYARYLQWRSELTLEPPRRPRPDRVSGAAASRNEEWKFGLVGSRDRESGAINLPPARVSMVGGAVDDMESVPMSGATGTVVTFTVDHMTYSPSPPIVFAVIDFDGGGRFACELTDVVAAEVGIGDRVQMTFRRLFTEAGIHNYFWKARPTSAHAVKG